GKLYLTTARYEVPMPASVPGASAPTSQPSEGATPPAAPPEGRVHPDVPIRLTVRSAEQLELLRVRARVAPPSKEPPPTSASTARPDGPEKLKLAILALDDQLARAVELLKAGQISATRPASGRIPKLRKPVGQP
ncbi:hypothetical protein LCGC14_3041160, partial [marine sediment metagenome]